MSRKMISKLSEPERLEKLAEAEKALESAQTDRMINSTGEATFDRRVTEAYHRREALALRWAPKEYHYC